MRIGRINFGSRPDGIVRHKVTAADEDRVVRAALARERGLTLTDDSWLGLLQQVLDGYAKEDDVPSDVAELVTQLQERLVEIAG